MKKWASLLTLLMVLQAVSTTLYLGKAEDSGFPLDDAWIHQTYARNLGLHGVMAFSPGIPSTGSTSAGWTALLAAGYFFHIPFFFWAYLWGCIFAVATAFTAACLGYSYFENFRNAVIVALICIFEWHLAWAAVSGMEISLFSFLSLLFFLMINRSSPPYLMGLVAAFAFLVRPEGVLLIVLYGIKTLIENRKNLTRFLIKVTWFGTVLLLIISPWMIFNLTYSGHPFPSTISSKFVQYGYPFSVWNSLHYLWSVFLYFVNGPLMLLVPGAGFVAYRALRQKQTSLYYPVAWVSSLILIYSVALPAIYHHGRYLMPLIPILAIFGVEGMVSLFERYHPKQYLQNVTWFVLSGMLIALWINGAFTFALQVKLLNEIHGNVAHWLDSNIPKDATIATHDIGIIGYFAQRRLIDLAGLVTPEVIPIMNDQAKLADFVRQRNVSYVVVFTGYYKEFLKDLDAQSVYSPHQVDTKRLGLEPFEVFRVPAP